MPALAQDASSTMGWSRATVSCEVATRELHFGSEVLVTRKGAVSARSGQLGIIPGSMGARSFIVRGKGNAESFHSCSHGAGRIMSRTDARRRFTVADHIKETEGVECRKDEAVIDETPAAYKDIDAVMAAQADLVEVVHTLKQALCIKGWVCTLRQRMHNMADNRSATNINNIGSRRFQMGAWGHKTFDNDNASDWLYELEESSDLSVIEDALSLDDDYIEAPDGCIALAAAEILLALAGKPHSEIPENAAAWVAGHSQLNGEKLIPIAAASLAKVLSDNSELRDLWQETDDFAAWKDDVQGIIAALKEC